MKKVWIASILACIMLLVPFTNVISANEVEDCNCNPTISDSQVVRIERLLDRLESRINFILLRYGHIPEVKEKCQKVLDIINSEGPWEDFCNDFYDFILFLWSFLGPIFGSYICIPLIWILSVVCFPFIPWVIESVIR